MRTHRHAVSFARHRMPPRKRKGRLPLESTTTPVYYPNTRRNKRMAFPKPTEATATAAAAVDTKAATDTKAPASADTWCRGPGESRYRIPLVETGEPVRAPGGDPSDTDWVIAYVLMMSNGLYNVRLHNTKTQYARYVTFDDLYAANPKMDALTVAKVEHPKAESVGTASQAAYKKTRGVEKPLEKETAATAAAAAQPEPVRGDAVAQHTHASNETKTFIEWLNLLNQTGRVWDWFYWDTVGGKEEEASIGFNDHVTLRAAVEKANNQDWSNGPFKAVLTESNDMTTVSVVRC